MDLTPQLFRDVEFTERRGSYDKDEVNAFLARVGTAVGQMQERLRDSHRRVEGAEARVAELEAAARNQTDADETMRRTLVLAQRTADAAVQEAKDEAEVIVAEARQRADDMIVQAEEAVRRDVGATRDRLEAEIRDLEQHRDEMRERIGVITSHLETERARLHAELDAIKSVLDDPTRVAISEVPGTEPEPVIVLSDSQSERSPAIGSQQAAADTPSEPLAPIAGSEDLSHLPPPPEDWEQRDVESGPVDASDADDEPPSPRLFGSGDPAAPADVDRWADDGPATEPHPVIGAGSSFGGSHLDELRRAVSEEANDPESDAAMAAFFDQDNDADPGRRFGRRR